MFYLNVCGGWSSQSRWVRFQSKFLPHWLMIFYSTLMSFTIAATTAVLVGGIAASRTGSSSLVLLTVATAAVAALRAFLVIDTISTSRPSPAMVVRYIAGNDVVRNRCLGLRGMPWQYLLRWLCIYRRPTLPVAAWYLRGRIYGRDYGAYLQPAVDRRNAGFPHFNAHHPRQCVSRRVGLYGVVGVHFPVLPRHYRTGAILGRKPAAPAARDWRKGCTCLLAGGTEFPIRRRACQHVPWPLHVCHSNHRLLVWNKRFCEIYKIPPGAVSPGIAIRNSSS